METTRSSGVLRVLREALGKRANASEEEGAESGFTLIELMVVLLIMAILLAIAIPTFLGVQGGAQDRAAQSNLTTAFTSAKAYYANHGSSYVSSASLVAALGTQEPELTFTTGTVALTAKNGLNSISVDVGTAGNSVILADQSKNANNCWYLASTTSTKTSFTSLSASVGTSYGAGTGTSTGCAASNVASTAPTSGWQRTYPAHP
ncbi:MAG: type II secretion system GspH family protein [Actinobacteria bacterium]|jgi:type IV pilus assembly protein PilA|nr:type II secretion system GspH family protein [Actinomycetota bacterium]